MQCQQSISPVPQVIAGNILIITAKFTDSSGTIVTPSTVKITIASKNGIVSSDVAMIASSSDSSFSHDLDTTALLPGNYSFVIKSTGSLQSAGRGLFEVI